MRSTDECEISRSCHNATFSIAGSAYERTIRASPVRFSDKTGLRLWGIADEPFWPGEKYSSASSTSVRWRWRISIDSRSIEEATTASVAKYIAWRSRGITWVETGSGTSPSLAATYSSTRGSRLANVPTAPEIAQVATSLRASTSRSRARENSAYATASLTPNVVGSAWMPCERPMVRVSLCSNARVLSAASSRSTPAISRSAARTNCTFKQVSSTSDEVSPKCTKRASGPTNSARWVRNAITSCLVTRSISSMRATSNVTPAPLSQIVLAASLGMMPSSAHADAAWASISNQMR